MTRHLDERHALTLDLWIGDVASCADDLEATLSQLHEMKREVDGETREALLVAIDKTQAAWAAAAVARTALRDVTL